MRIIAGRFGSRRIKMVDSIHTRETSDKIRGAVFNTLASRVNDALVLDLFAGSGAYGFEALSRGASQVVLNDFDHQALKTIRTNALDLKVENEVRIIGLDYLKAIDLLRREGHKFDLVFLDPPYQKGYYGKAIQEIVFLLKLNSCLVVELPKNEELVLEPSLGLVVFKEAFYGNKKIVYLQCEEIK